MTSDSRGRPCASTSSQLGIGVTSYLTAQPDTHLRLFDNALARAGAEFGVWGDPRGNLTCVRVLSA